MSYELCAIRFLFILPALKIDGELYYSCDSKIATLYLIT